MPLSNYIYIIVKFDHLISSARLLYAAVMTVCIYVLPNWQHSVYALRIIGFESTFLPMQSNGLY